MQELSFVLSALGTAALIISFIIKGKKMGLILFFAGLANFSIAMSYLVGGSGINGAYSCFLGTAIAVVNSFFSKAEKKIPFFLLVIYALLFAALNFAVGGICVNSLIAVCATTAFVLGLAAPNGKVYRTCSLFNVFLWCFYDVLTRSNAALCAHLIQFGMLLVGIFINDRKPKD